ncbi:MAG: transglycosylase SLT domain-containing protein [Patescibacteria group bacterium]|nr:transglycosylase SLT domain-containing protein [Patescibacteria group bacterium]
MRKYKRLNRTWTVIVITIILTTAIPVIHKTNDITIVNTESKPLEEPAPINEPVMAVIVEPIEKPISKSYDKNEIIDYIREQSVLNGLNPELVLSIAECESGFNPNAKNKISSAGGVFQFIDSTFLYVNSKRGTNYTLSDKMDYKKNIDSAIWLMKNQGPTHWECYNLNML